MGNGSSWALAFDDGSWSRGRPASLYDDTRPPEQLNLWFWRYLNRWSLLLAWTLASLLWQLALELYLLISGHSNVEHFTYWSTFMFTVVTTLLFPALVVRRGMLTFVLLWLLPIVMGVSLFVAIAIVVIIQQNAEAFIMGTVCDGGTTSMSTVHTGDFALHQLLPLQVFVWLSCGLLDEARDVLRGRFAEWSLPLRVLYSCYFLLSPLVPLVIWGSIYDARQIYYISWPTWLLWFLSVLLMLFIQLNFLWFFTLDARRKLTVDDVAALRGGRGDGRQRAETEMLVPAGGGQAEAGGEPPATAAGHIAAAIGHAAFDDALVL